MLYYKNRVDGGRGTLTVRVYVCSYIRLQMLFDDCRLSGVRTRSPAFDVVVVAKVARGFSQFCVIAMKSGNAGFDISVAIYSVHLAMSLRALGSLVGSS